MQLYFIRHGQSINNAGWGDPNYEESPDPILTEIGIQQAQILSEYLEKNQRITEHKDWDCTTVTALVLPTSTPA